mmetsp:Transcript_95218/g.142681  ORF Transcript_95218/g.142681 Transcript_95218/m.142681 type:complete len:118 (+) Transcript_95218:93-446(+)
MLRETGLALDINGSKLTKDIAHLENLSRHRNVMPLYEFQPSVSKDAFIAPNCTIVGDVLVGCNSAIWYGAVLRGDNNAIRIGLGSIVGDNSIIDTTHSLPTGVPISTNIGNNVTIEP